MQIDIVSVVKVQLFIIIMQNHITTRFSHPQCLNTKVNKVANNQNKPLKIPSPSKDLTNFNLSEKMFAVPNIKERKSYMCGTWYITEACHEHKLIQVLFNVEAVNKRTAVCRHRTHTYYIKGSSASNERKATDELRLGMRLNYLQL